MRKLGILYTLFSISLLGISCTDIQERNPLVGLWKVNSITNLTTNQQEPLIRQYYMFTDSHMMIIIAGEDRPKIKKSLADMNGEEVLSQQPIGAGFYSYKIEGDTLVRSAQITLSAYYEGSTFHTQYSLEDDTLSIQDSHAADGNLREWKMTKIE